MTDDPIWPDPGGWVARLNEKLVRLDLQYHGISQIRRMRADPDEIGNEELIDDEQQLRANETLTAAASLAAIVDALKEIPTFQGNVGLTALTDLGLALSDLDRGLRPALLQPRPAVRSTNDGSGRRLIKATVVLCVELLELAGYTNAAARKAIAQTFASAGFEGRKGKPLPAQTVYDWMTALSVAGADPDGRKLIDRGMGEWRRVRIWPPRAPEVLSYAAERAADPALHTKI